MFTSMWIYTEVSRRPILFNYIFGHLAQIILNRTWLRNSYLASCIRDLQMYRFFCVCYFFGFGNNNSVSLLCPQCSRYGNWIYRGWWGSLAGWYKMHIWLDRSLCLTILPKTSGEGRCFYIVSIANQLIIIIYELKRRNFLRMRGLCPTHCINILGGISRCLGDRWMPPHPGKEVPFCS
jgi:hypothetical protein